MPMSVSMQASYDRMMEWGKRLTAYDFGNTCVRIVHDEGSTFFLENAFIVDPGGDIFGCPKDAQYIWVFTEHQGYLIFHKDDLMGWNTLSCVPNHSVNYRPRSNKGFPDAPRRAEDIIAEQMPDYEISDEPTLEEHENIEVFYLTPKNPEDDRGVTVAVSVVQGRIIGRQA